MGEMGLEDKDYVILSDFEVDLSTDGDADEGNGLFILCFWLYLNSCISFPAVILEQKFLDATSRVPFLFLNEKKMMTLFPLRCIHQEAPDPASIQWAGVPCASSKSEFPVKKWVHIGCEVLQDLLRLYIDGEIVGEKHLTFANKKELLANILKSVYLMSPDGNEKTFHGYAHGLDVFCTTSAVKDHYTKDPPVHLSIDYSSASDIEEDSDGVWSIVGGKASCRRIFSLDVILSDVFGCPVNKDLEVVASLLYADNESPVDDTNDAEPPLLMSYDGIEYASPDKPCKLINGRASFKLKISQLSSKCENRLFRIRFGIQKYGKYPFLDTHSLPIRCVSRYRNARTTSLSWRKPSDRIYYINGCESPGFDDGSVEMIPNIVREAKPSPSSKRIKLGQDQPFAMHNEDFSLKQAYKEIDSRALTTNEDHTYVVNTDTRRHNPYRAENNSSASLGNQATNSDPKLSISSPISYLNVFKYCLADPAERCQLLKAISVSANEEQLLNFANEVSLYSGCLHHRHQISITKKVLGGLQAWNSISENKQHVRWETFAFRINGLFLKIACCNRSLTDQDLECLRRIAGCQDLVSEENFERMWYWLYPVAFNISKKALNRIWDLLSPLWVEGFITKEEAEFLLHGEGLQEPGTFVLRFPTSRSWPHPDAGNLVVTYVGSDCSFHHRLLSLDFIDSSLNEMKPLQDMLLEEPELSRLARPRRTH